MTEIIFICSTSVLNMISKQWVKNYLPKIINHQSLWVVICKKLMQVELFYYDKITVIQTCFGGSRKIGFQWSQKKFLIEVMLYMWTLSFTVSRHEMGEKYRSGVTSISQ